MEQLEKTHTINYRWWRASGTAIVPADVEQLKKCAIERATAMIACGEASGKLSYMYDHITYWGEWSHTCADRSTMFEPGSSPIPYRVVRGDTAASLSITVNQLCAEGWTPQGGICVLPNGLCAQAMVRA